MEKMETELKMEIDEMGGPFSAATNLSYSSDPALHIPSSPNHHAKDTIGQATSFVVKVDDEAPSIKCEENCDESGIKREIVNKEYFEEDVKEEIKQEYVEEIKREGDGYVKEEKEEEYMEYTEDSPDTSQLSRSSGNLKSNVIKSEEIVVISDDDDGTVVSTVNSAEPPGSRKCLFVVFTMQLTSDPDAPLLLGVGVNSLVVLLHLPKSTDRSTTRLATTDSSHMRLAGRWTTAEKTHSMPPVSLSTLVRDIVLKAQRETGHLPTVALFDSQVHYHQFSRDLYPEWPQFLDLVSRSCILERDVRGCFAKYAREPVHRAKYVLQRLDSDVALRNLVWSASDPAGFKVLSPQESRGSPFVSSSNVVLLNLSFDGPSNIASAMLVSLNLKSMRVEMSREYDVKAMMGMSSRLKLLQILEYLSHLKQLQGELVLVLSSSNPNVAVSFLPLLREYNLFHKLASIVKYVTTAGNILSSEKRDSVLVRDIANNWREYACDLSTVLWLRKFVELVEDKVFKNFPLEKDLDLAVKLFDSFKNLRSSSVGREAPMSMKSKMESQMKHKTKQTVSSMCPCFDTTNISFCFKHPAAKIKIITEMTIHPNTIRTFLAELEHHNTGLVSRVKILSPKGYTSPCVCAQTESLVFGNKLFVTMINNGPTPFFIMKGKCYAMARFSLPFNELHENLSDESSSTQHTIYACPTKMLSPGETYVLQCRLDPPLPSGTLVQVKDTSIGLAFLDEFCTIQLDSSLVVTVRCHYKYFFLRPDLELGSVTNLCNSEGISYLKTMYENITMQNNVQDGECLPVDYLDEKKKMSVSLEDEQLSVSLEEKELSVTMEKKDLSLSLDTRTAVFSQAMKAEIPKETADAADNDIVMYFREDEPFYYLATLKDITIKKKGSKVVMTELRVLRNSYTMETATITEELLGILESGHLKCFNESNEIVLSTKIARVYQGRYVFLHLKNMSETEKITLPEEFVVGKAQPDFQYKDIVSSCRPYSFKVATPVKIHPGNKVHVDFVACKYDSKCFGDCVYNIHSTNLPKNVVVKKGLVAFENNRIVLKIENKSERLVLLQGHMVSVYFDALNCQELKDILYEKRKDHIFTSPISFRIVKQLLKAENHLELFNLSPISIPPSQITSCLIKIEGCPNFAESIIVTNNWTSDKQNSKFRVITSVQPVYEREFAFIAIENLGEETLSIAETSALIAFGYPSKQKNSFLRNMTIVCPENLELKPGATKDISCSVKNFPENMITLITMEKPMLSAVKISPSFATAYSIKKRRDNVRISITNTSSDVLNLYAGEHLCDVKSMMHMKFIESLLEAMNYTRKRIPLVEMTDSVPAKKAKLAESSTSSTLSCSEEVDNSEVDSCEIEMNCDIVPMTDIPSVEGQEKTDSKLTPEQQNLDEIVPMNNPVQSENILLSSDSCTKGNRVENIGCMSEQIHEAQPQEMVEETNISEKENFTYSCTKGNDSENSRCISEQVPELEQQDTVKETNISDKENLTHSCRKEYDNKNSRCISEQTPETESQEATEQTCTLISEFKTQHFTDDTSSKETIGQSIFPTSSSILPTSSSIPSCQKFAYLKAHTLYDITLSVRGTTTVLVRVENPSSVSPSFLQTLPSSLFSVARDNHKGLGLSRNVIRKVYDGEYIFLSVFNKSESAGLVLKKGFHIADCRPRSEADYKASAPEEIAYEKEVVVQSKTNLSIAPGQTVTVHVKLDMGTAQNSENMHQLYRVAIDTAPPGVTVRDRFFTSEGCSNAFIDLHNGGASAYVLDPTDKTHVLFKCRSVINLTGCREFVKELEQGGEWWGATAAVKEASHVPLVPPNTESMDGEAAAAAELCECNLANRPPFLLLPGGCGRCEVFSIRAMSSFTVLPDTTVTFLGEIVTSNSSDGVTVTSSGSGGATVTSSGSGGATVTSSSSSGVTVTSSSSSGATVTSSSSSSGGVTVNSSSSSGVAVNSSSSSGVACRYMAVLPIEKFSRFVQPCQREVFDRRYIFVTIVARRTVRVKQEEVIGQGWARSRPRGDIRQIGAEESLDVYVDSLGTRLLQPKEITEIKLRIPECWDQFTQNQQLRHELFQLTSSFLLDRNLVLEEGGNTATVTMADMNLLFLRLYNTADKLVTLPTRHPLFHAQTLFTREGAHQILRGLEKTTRGKSSRGKSKEGKSTKEKTSEEKSPEGKPTDTVVCKTEPSHIEIIN